MGRNSYSTMERRWFNPPVSWPFARVLSKCGHVLSETDDAPVPRVMLRIICECVCRLLALKTHNGDELAEIFGFPEQFSRKIAPDPGLHIALPVLMQGNDSILLASLGPVCGDGHEHLSSPLLHRELTCALQAAGLYAQGWSYMHWHNYTVFGSQLHRETFPSLECPAECEKLCSLWENPPIEMGF